MSNTAEFYILRGKITGPYSANELFLWIEGGRAAPDLVVCLAGTDEWQPLANHYPAEVAASASKAVARQRRNLLVTAWVAVFICMGALLGAWVLRGGALKEKQNAVQQLTAVQEAREAGVRQAADAEQKARRLEGQAGDAEKKASTVEQKLLQKDHELTAKRAELEAKNKRIKEVETVARDYAKKLVTQTTALQVSGMVPNTVKVITDWVGKGPLDVDESGIKALVENEFSRAGYHIQEDDTTDDDAVLVEVKFSQLEVTEGINSAYLMSLRCYTKCVVGTSVGRYLAFTESTFGHAGIRSTYIGDVAYFYITQAGEAITKLREMSDEAIESSRKNDVSSLYKDLVAAGISPEEKESAKESAKPASSGSGVVIASRPLILTNHHVVDEAKRVVTYLGDQPGGKEAVVLFSDRARDLAVLALKERVTTYNEAVFPSLADNDDVATGADVFSLGYPLTSFLGKEVKYSAGAVSSQTGMNGDDGQFQLSVPTQPGNSGGPVFLKTGSFCGVMVSTLNAVKMIKDASTVPQNVNYAIKPSVIRSFLSEHGLWDEVQSGKHADINIEQAKKLAVRIEVYE